MSVWGWFWFGNES